MMIRMVGGWVFLLVPGHPGSPGQRAVKRLLSLLLLQIPAAMLDNEADRTKHESCSAHHEWKSHCCRQVINITNMCINIPTWGRSSVCPASLLQVDYQELVYSPDVPTQHQIFTSGNSNSKYVIHSCVLKNKTLECWSQLQQMYMVYKLFHCRTPNDTDYVPW